MPDVMNTNVHYRTTSSSLYEQPNFTVPPPGPSPIYSTGGLPHSNPPEVSMNYEPWTSRPNTGNPWGLPQRMSIPRALELAASLRGPAQSILSDLSPDNRKSIHHLVEALTIRFEPENQNEIYRSQLKSRLHKKGDYLGTLAQDITKLVRKAYPSDPAETKINLPLILSLTL